MRSFPFQRLRAWRAYPVPWTASAFIQGIVPLQEKSHYVLHHLTSASGLSCFDSDLYWLLCLDPGFISCVCSPSSFSDITQIPWYPQTLFLSLIYTDHTLRHAQLQHGAFFQPASAKAPKSSTWDVLQHLQSPYKNSPHSFLSLFKATSRRSQMHKAQVVQDSMQCREGRAGDLARPENLAEISWNHFQLQQGPGGC